jgi:hypothetical protein
MNIRMSEDVYKQMRDCTARSFANGVSFPPESGCVLLVNQNDHPLNPSILVTSILTPGNGDLSAQHFDGLVFSSAFLRRALLIVRESGLAGFLTVHTHPGSDQSVAFSEYDNRNDPLLMSNLTELKADGVFGSIVLGKRSAAARLWRRDLGDWQAMRNLMVIGETLDWVTDGSVGTPSPQAAAIFDRGLAVTQGGALAKLSQMKIGVVGASGTGSLILELLVRAGVGKVIIFDFDSIEESNLNRILHSRRSDLGMRKAHRISQALSETGLPSIVISADEGDIRARDVAMNLRECDLVFGCVDRDWPRLILSELAYQYLIPYIDVGTEIGTNDKEIQSLDSRVSYVAPGRPCLICSSIVSPERMRLEGFENTEYKRVIAMGYSQDVFFEAPAVMDLNMRAASYAVLVLRHLLQAFLDSPLPIHIKETLTNFSMRAIRSDKTADCPICGANSRFGRGDSMRLTTRI